MGSIGDTNWLVLINYLSKYHNHFKSASNCKSQQQGFLFS